eukprot:Nitzschia sp. Nitz4//scaffold101_size76361//44631//46809//NITZ4_005605-RA/size76361-augustus-gene-0.12-mRNA-1//-1//CDS//3329532167//202//frame0
MTGADGGLGSSLIGEKIAVGQSTLHVTKLLGEGGFSYVYLVKEITEMTSSSHVDTAKAGDEAAVSRASGSHGKDEKKVPMVLKITSIHSRAQRDIAEKEAKLLSRLNHPSIVKIFDTCYRTVSTASTSGSGAGGKSSKGATKERPQHVILMEYCEGGHALDVCNKLASNNKRFDLPSLIIAFGQICNAVSYLHAQRPPIVHRDLKPLNFLVKNGAYKLCDFGSAVFGHVDLRTPKARADAEEVIQKTTTQMFRAPEMVDLYMAKKLTQATDVWALGCCLYSLAYLQNCFEEGSNLAILSGKYTIPEDNPYGDGLVELLDRMLTADSKARADMTEVILCLSAIYSGRPLPPRKASKSSKTEGGEAGKDDKGDDSRKGSYRTDGQGIREVVYDPTKATEGKKLASNSVAARRKRAAATAATFPPTAPTASAAAPAETSDPLDFTSFGAEGKVEDGAFASDVGFGEMKGFETKGEGNDNDFFGSFDKAAAEAADAPQGGNDGFGAAAATAFSGDAWGEGQTAPDAAAADPVDVPSGTPSLQDEAEEVPDISEHDDKDGLNDSQSRDRTQRRKSGDGSRERRSRPPSKPEEGGARRSGSRSRRKGRPSKGEEELTQDRRAIKKGPGRGKAPDP